MSNQGKGMKAAGRLENRVRVPARLTLALTLTLF
jgi:hypothetical protein